MKRVIASFIFDSGNGSICKIELDSSTQKIKVEGETYPHALMAVLDFQKNMKDVYPPISINNPTTK